MSAYTEPSETEFQSAENTLQAVLAEHDSTITTAKGSVIRELLIRPAAYIYSWVSNAMSTLLYKASVAYLSTSQATSNPVADAVASNYFVTRRVATKSSGLVTLSLTQAIVRIPKGARFTVSGEPFETLSMIIISNVELSGQLSGTTYVRSVQMGDIYKANIPISACNTGALEIPTGSDVVIGFSSYGLSSAELTSAITGGADAETDASMMLRAKHSVADAGVGSYNGLRKRLDDSGLTVTGMSVDAGESVSMFRARFNNININPGGFVDLYVKTQNQPSARADVFALTEVSAGSYTASVALPDTAGLFYVSSVMAGGAYVSEFTTSFGTSDSLTGATGSRLSDKQTVQIAFSADTGLTEATVTVLYMPGVSAVQTYLDSDEGKFFGQDVLVKAAVPVEVGVRCAVQSATTLDSVTLAGIKSVIAAYINTLPVGTSTLNFSDLAVAVSTVYPDVTLRLPCVFTAGLVLRDGTKDSLYSESGVLDISWMPTETHWSATVCFFSATTSNMEITQI